MTVEGFMCRQFHEHGDIPGMDIVGTSGRVYARYDMDRETHLEEGVSPDDLSRLTVVSAEGVGGCDDLCRLTVDDSPLYA